MCKGTHQDSGGNASGCVWLNVERDREAKEVDWGQFMRGHPSHAEEFGCCRFVEGGVEGYLESVTGKPRMTSSANSELEGPRFPSLVPLSYGISHVLEAGSIIPFNR